MGFYFRKSFKIAPGVRFNVTSKGSSLSGSIPGTGIRWTTRSSSKKSSTNWKAVGRVCYWLLIGWWWWPIRLLCYDLPRWILTRIVQLVKVWKAKQKYER